MTLVVPRQMVTTVAQDLVHARLGVEGLCASQGPDDDRWMPDAGRTPSGAYAAELVAAARAACAGCPVLALCATWALDTGQEYGTWGGLAEHELRSIRARRRREAAAARPGGSTRPAAAGPGRGRRRGGPSSSVVAA